ncbi:MAG: serine acetyltransferase [Cytophagaceae bacterium]|nr:serine acetyltransferase [Cytophagaceae bacterium]
MIKDKKDYLFYLEADCIALGRKKKGARLLYRIFFPDEIWNFQKVLRRLEYTINCKLKNKKNIFTTLEYYYILWHYRKLSYKLGFTIPPNVFGPGLSIAHYGTIVINNGAKVGANCCLNTNVNIGTEAGFSDKAPVIGDNVFIGPGAKIFGAIKIANGIAIGANAVVNKNFEEENILIAGIPAKKIKETNTDSILINATKIISDSKIVAT